MAAVVAQRPRLVVQHATPPRSKVPRRRPNGSCADSSATNGGKGLPAGTRRQRRAEGPALLGDLAAMRDGGAPFEPGDDRGTGRDRVRHRDGDRHRRAALELADEIPGAELVTIDGRFGHNAHDSHPAEFAAFVRKVLNR